MLLTDALHQRQAQAEIAAIRRRAADKGRAQRLGIQAGAGHDWLKPGDTRVLAKTPMLGGQETATVTFPVAALTAGQPYTCFCSFPAHAAQMRGMLVVGGELGHPHVHIDGLIQPP
ncbi:cupredoxin domain-containing protein [Bordetella trematum]|uniref:hypothetical protein n=1 Tax=Bordetella trematum TaxID=123899 RepID=UPI003988AA89